MLIIIASFWFRELESELEEEQKQRTAAVTARKKLEGDLKDMESQLEMNNKLKEDALKQLKRMGGQLKEYQREADEARIGKEEMTSQYKEMERKIKIMETELLQYQEDISSLERAKKVNLLCSLYQILNILFYVTTDILRSV